ncbi:hypothetical protein [Sporosarcina sp. FSL K6-1508]
MEERIEQLEKEVEELKLVVAAVTTTGVASQVKAELENAFTRLNKYLS